MEQAGDQADDEHVERSDADEGEDRPERAGVRAEAEAADQVGERRYQDGDRHDDQVAAAWQQPRGDREEKRDAANVSAAVATMRPPALATITVAGCCGSAVGTKAASRSR